MAISKRSWISPAGEKRSAWEVSYCDQQGKRRRKQFARKKDADAWLVNARSQVADGIHTPESQSITVADAAELWLRSCARGRDGRDPVEPHTLRSYDSHVRLHIEPLMGTEKLGKLTTPRVAAFRDALIDTRSRAMSKKILTSFKAIITEAQARGLVAQNVAKAVSVSMASRHKKDVIIPSKDDIRTILEETDRLQRSSNIQIAKSWNRYHALLMTAAFTGLRASELRGLYWEHINLKDGTVSILQRADELGIIGSVKSSAGKRRISIPSALVGVLRQWKLKCPPGELVFPNWQGNVETHGNIINRCWNTICRKCKLVTPQSSHLAEHEREPIYNFHMLRHFHASMLIASSATSKEVQVEMGHSSIQVTFDTYGHLFPDDEASRARRAEQMASEIL